MRIRWMSIVLTCAIWCAVGSTAEAAQGSGCMPTTGTVSGLTFAQDVNSGIAALISSNSGNSAPNTDCIGAPVKGQIWLDTSQTPNLLKQYDGTSSWVLLGALDAANHLWAPPVGGGTASITAASTTDICAAPGSLQSITGTTTITGFGSSCAAPGVRKTLIFNSATPLTYNATSLIIPGQLDYTTSAGDVADAMYLGSANWRIISITKIDGSAVTNPAIPLGTVFFGDFASPPSKTVYGYGQAISRSSYPAYFAAVTLTQSGTLTAGNNTITGLASTDGLGANMPIEGTGVQAGTVISSIASPTSIVMSKTATANGSQSISVIKPGYGTSGDSTTVGVKDCRGNVLAGRDNPLGSAAGRLTSTYLGANPNAVNNLGGNQTTVLLQSNLPNVTFANSGIAINSTFTMSYGYNGPTGSTPIQAGLGTYTAGGSLTESNIIHSGIAGITLTSSVTNQGSAASGGSGTPFRTIQPTAIAECVVAVLP